MAQLWLPTILTESGDTLDYNFSLPMDPDMYIHDELIIRFRPEALNLSFLCYGMGGPKVKNKDEIQAYPYAFRQVIMNEKFFVDDIVVDSALAAAMRSFGGDTLTRITFANPCTDTISITRYGDTLLCEDYLWMKLHLDNDTSVTAASIQLSYLHQNALIIAQPNFLYEPQSDMVPDDERYPEQISLKDRIGIEKAWETTTGRYDVIVGVIDDGIYYPHCDLGGAMGAGHKVSWGYNYYLKNDRIDTMSQHGTKTAGIIGALSNQTQPECGELRGVAGIAGGWADSIGCQLMGYKVDDPNHSEWSSDFIIAAIRESSADTEYEVRDDVYGKANHILNFSAVLKQSSAPDFAMVDAVNYAFEHGASFVNARGNSPPDSGFPGTAFTQKTISVGAAKENKTLRELYPHGNNMDLIAPSISFDIKTTDYSRHVEYSPEWDFFAQSSAAAPHVAGVLALLRSYALSQPFDDDKVWKFLEPEDYEGILLASALDRTEAQDTNYHVGYDEHTGWGHLQADKIFELLEDSNYVVLHFETPCFDTYCESENSVWTEPYDVYFLNNSITGFHFFSTGWHTVRRRERRLTINLDSLNNIDSVKAKRIVTDANTPMYAWGRKGRNGLGGYSAENLPNFQTRWTKVTSSTGIPEGENTVPGIIHTNNKTIELLTYQYQMVDAELNPMGPPFPHDEMILFNFSIFCKYDELVGVNEQTVLRENPDINIYPNPASNHLNIEINNSNQYLNEIEITDIFGQRLLRLDSRSGNLSSKTKIDISDFSSGKYFCKLRIGNNVVTKSFTVIK